MAPSLDLEGTGARRPLANPVLPAAVDLVDAARRRKLVLYLGAGISIPSPSDGPRGNQVADVLRHVVGEILRLPVADLAGLNLEQLAERVEQDAPERLNHLKSKAADAWNFRAMLANTAHEAIALLMREGVVSVVSANWDRALENGGEDLGITIVGVAHGVELHREGVNMVQLLKVHGCARWPGTLVLTRSEVDEPARWARNAVQDALTGGTVVFAGLGTVGSYVGQTVPELKQLWSVAGVTIRVVDPAGASDDWRQILGDSAQDAIIELGAEEFFDELLRAVVTDALSNAAAEARSLVRATEEPWPSTVVGGLEALTKAFDASTADAVLRWWRGSVTKDLDGQSFVSERAGLQTMLAVAQISAQCGGPPSVEGRGGDLTVRAGTRYFEIGCWPGASVREVEAKVRARIEKRRASGRYPHGAQFSAVIHSANGDFPEPSAPTDIAAGDDPPADIAAGRLSAVSCHRAEDVANGRLV